MTTYTHLFFDMDKTIAPSRQPILPEMYDLLVELAKERDIIIVSGQTVEKIRWQSNNLPAIVMGQNGNEAVDLDGTELWHLPLSDEHRQEMLNHIAQLRTVIDHEINEDWNPIEDRGAQITFSPIGNTAPVEKKIPYDPDMKKRLKMIAEVPFESEELVAKIGGTTGFDYIHKDRHKGTAVQRLIDHNNWKKEDCVYIGDGLFPGGNDEAVIGVVDTIPVTDHLDTYNKLKEMFA